MSKKAELNINDNKMVIYYAESLQTRLDTLSDLSVMKKMNYVELLCFISRIAHEIFKESKQENLGLHLKIDQILTPIFAEYKITKLFTFKEEADGEGVGDDSESDGSDGGSGGSGGD